MSIFSRKKLPFNPERRLFWQAESTSSQQPLPFCTWSAHAPQSGFSPSPFPRNSHTLTATATAAAGELFLFGGYALSSASSDLYMFSTRDFSTTLLQTTGEVPIPRYGHGGALTGTTLLIYGGTTNFSFQNLSHDSLYLLNLVSREWSRVMVNGFGPGGRLFNTVTMVGSQLFVFGGLIGGKYLNDMWALDLNSLKSQPFWEAYDFACGNEKPLPRIGHVSVTTGDRIIIFGGFSAGGQHHYFQDTWSFDISTRKWTELQCTGSIPSPRTRHAVVLVDDVMYVFGGYTGETYLDDLIALHLPTQRWFKFHNVGSSPHRRSNHTMASDGTRVFVLGGYSDSAGDELSLIHVFDTKHIKYPEPEHNAFNLNEKTTELGRKSSAGPLTQEQPQHMASSSSEAYGFFPLQNATPAVSAHPASPQILHKRNPGPNGDDVYEGSTEYHAKFAAPDSSSEGEVARLKLERQLSVSLAAQTERDRRISRQTDELALKGALLEQAEANAAEAAKRAGLELREHADRLLVQTSLVKQRDEELKHMQAKLDTLNELLLSRDQQIKQHEKELANAHTKLKAKDSELGAVRLRLADAEKGWNESKAEADTLRAQTATGSVNKDRDQLEVTRMLMERMRALEVEVASKHWNEKSIEDMECRNEG